MSELIEIGGVCPLMKMLLGKGLLNGKCLTVSGKTIAENFENIKPYPEKQTIIAPFENPIKKDISPFSFKNHFNGLSKCSKSIGKLWCFIMV